MATNNVTATNNDPVALRALGKYLQAAKYGVALATTGKPYNPRAPQTRAAYDAVKAACTASPTGTISAAQCALLCQQAGDAQWPNWALGKGYGIVAAPAPKATK